MADHFDGCWELESHPACRLQKIRELEAEIERLTPKVPVLTHAAFIPVHGDGPTWHGCNDDPPSTTL